VDIDDAAGTGGEAGLDKGIVFYEVVLVEGSSKDVVGEELPSNRKAEHIETIVIDKVLHLAGTIVTIICE
jgi:CO dehydrogenase/acetyl-CoA synthase epsilon subunit